MTRTDLQSLTFDGVSSITAASLPDKTDSLTGPNTATAWTVANDTTGTITPGSQGTIAFSGFSELDGGTGQDTLTGPDGGSTFHVAGPHQGWFVGSVSTTVTDPNSGSQTTVSEVDLLFSGFDVLVAGSGTNDVLSGPTALESQDQADPNGYCDVPVDQRPSDTTPAPWRRRSPGP